MQIEWRFKSYDDLSKSELHQIMVLRQQVFVVEQNCPYQDADEKDISSHHLMGYIQLKLVAYLRLVKPGISYPEMSFGRIVTAPSERGKGIGVALMKEGIIQSKLLYGTTKNRISAQSHLVPFYERFGFSTNGQEYLEDDIPHTEMLKY